MIIKEYRITLPLTVEEYQVAQLYSVAEASKNNTGGGEGVEVIKNEPFSDVPLLGGKFTCGQYTYKIYHLKDRVPTIFKYLIPEGFLQIHEEAWNAYPYCKTVLTNPGFMKENFMVSIESFHLSGDHRQENVHQLPDDVLKNREVVFVDIANDKIQTSDYKANEDPSKFQSEKTGRGPLVGSNWYDNVEPKMTCYKLVRVEFKWFALQKRAESFIHQKEHALFLNFHRQVFCWIDSWYGLTIEDIRRLEEIAQRELNEKRERANSLAASTSK